jgi:two-component system sensor histidine kinase YesM
MHPVRFRTRLLFTYSALVLLLVVALGIGFYRYSSTIFERNAYANLSALADRMAQQLDNLVRPMDFVTTYLLSDGGFMSSMASLSALDRAVPENLIYINEGWQTINGALLSYSVTKNFYSVNVFNRRGDFLSSNFRQHRDTKNVAGIIGSLSWIPEADRAAGRAVILPPYADPWSVAPGLMVYGLARSVQGPTGGMGYLEVQNPAEDLKRLFTVPDLRSLAVLAVTASGDVLYASRPMSSALVDYYSRQVPPPSREVMLARNPVSGQDEILAGGTAPSTGIRVSLAQEKTALLEPLVVSRNTTILLGILIVAVSFAFNLLSSRQLTRPILQLKEQMEKTELANLPERLVFERSHDEIASLNHSFERLRERLTDAVRREISSHSLQVEAQLDSLQAQVNPHFIYNVLTVLANKGLETGDEEIVSICDSLASMLRYSTSTAQRSATVEEEIEHVRTYLSLMKKRFEHRLEFTVDLPPEIGAEPIPKIVLQQITENSLTHGYRESQETMNVCVRGSLEDSRWIIECSDNGQGFPPEKLVELQARFRTIDAGLAEPERRHGFAIGGMGLVNTYGRLALFYGPGFLFQVENAPEGGAKVTIGAPRGARPAAGSG